MRSRGLNKKHQKALGLLRSTNLPVKEIAKQAGMSRQHLHDLISGKAKAGSVAADFHAKYQKHMDYVDQKASFESSLFIHEALSALSGWVKTLKRPDTLTRDELKSMIDILKLLNYMPNPVRGLAFCEEAMTREKLDSEFARLKSMAEAIMFKKSEKISLHATATISSCHCQHSAR